MREGPRVANPRSLAVMHGVINRVGFMPGKVVTVRRALARTVTQMPGHWAHLDSWACMPWSPS